MVTPTTKTKSRPFFLWLLTESESQQGNFEKWKNDRLTTNSWHQWHGQRWSLVRWTTQGCFAQWGNEALFFPSRGSLSLLRWWKTHKDGDIHDGDMDDTPRWPVTLYMNDIIHEEVWSHNHWRRLGFFIFSRVAWEEGRRGLCEEGKFLIQCNQPIAEGYNPLVMTSILY